jgi:hypothetical protein
MLKSSEAGSLDEPMMQRRRKDTKKGRQAQLNGFRDPTPMQDRRGAAAHPAAIAELDRDHPVVALGIWTKRLEAYGRACYRRLGLAHARRHLWSKTVSLRMSSPVFVAATARDPRANTVATTKSN